MLSWGPEHHAASLPLLRDMALGFCVHWRPDPLLFKKQVLCQNPRPPHREVLFRTHTL